jgi:hypothetical protein
MRRLSLLALAGAVLFGTATEAFAAVESVLSLGGDNLGRAPLYSLRWQFEPTSDSIVLELGSFGHGSRLFAPSGDAVREVATDSNASANVSLGPGFEFSLPSATVPEPASLVVWSVLGGAAGVAAARRRPTSANRRAPWSDDSRAAIHQLIERGRAR